MANAFIWYELMTGDVDKAVAFYGPVVGWEFRDSGMPGMQYMIFGKDGKDVGGLMSSKMTGSEMATKWVGHIHVTDVDAETKAVVADGGKEHRAPQEIPGVGRFSVVSDPQGAGYLLFQPNQTEAPPRLKPADVGAVGWRELATTDWEEAWTFYSRHYGWTKQRAVEMGAMGTYQTFMTDDTDGGGMMTIPPELKAMNPEPAWLFYFTVEDIQAAAKRVSEGGGKVIQEPMQVPGGGWILQGLDPQGGHFALTAAS